MFWRAARILNALTFFLMLTVGSQAKDMSDLYSTQDLERWRSILEEPWRKSFQMLLSQGLDEKEKQQASGASLEMPLLGRRKDLIEFYAEGKTVVVPVLSLKFLHDALFANAWLYLHKFDPRTVDEYVSMLKYNDATDFPDGRYPKPLDALGIPADARIPPFDSELEHAYFSTVNVTIGFIMAHELGHVVLGHTANSAKALKERVQQEKDADAFALRALSHIRPDAQNMTMFFSLTSVWNPMVTDFPSRRAYDQYVTEEADHPLTGDRLRALGKAVYDNPRLFLFRKELRGEMRSADRPTPKNIARIKKEGTNIIKLGDLVDDETHQRNLAIQGIGANLDRLKPRPLDVPSPARRPGSPH